MRWLSLAAVAALVLVPLAAAGETPGQRQLFLPIVRREYPLVTPFGVEANSLLLPGTAAYTRTLELGVSWVRLTDRAQWSILQPQEDGPLQWSNLAGFEAELRALRAADLRPVVTIDASPAWAVQNPNYACSAVRADKFEAYANFMQALVRRYSPPEFNVHDWELGNEPDVDPSLLPFNAGWGCWGSIPDDMYNGRHYGEMLKVVGPAIKQADPAARVWFGGLLLDNPNTPASDPDGLRGQPERFLEGALQAGAGPYFDILPYHVYPPYQNIQADHDLLMGPFSALGGGMVGKARYLRETLQRYGVDKTLFMNEGALMCPDDIFQTRPWCQPPGSDFFQIQADHLVRMFTRALANNVQGVMWYTIDYPGFRSSSLLDAAGAPRPAYTTYQFLIRQLQRAEYAGVSPLAQTDMQGYVFNRGAHQVHVLWASSSQTITVPLLSSTFVSAWTRDGQPITPGGQPVMQLPVGFSPVYVVQQP